MTFTLWTLALIGLVFTVLGFYEAFRDLNEFCRKGVVSRADFESKHPSGLTAGRVFDRSCSENQLALKKQFTRPSGRI